MTEEKRYWLALAERYFDCTASDDEEQRLATFVAASDDPDFNDVRAVMGYAATARRLRHRRTAGRRRWMAAAAGLLLVGMTTVYRLNMPNCIAYVHGERVTDQWHVVQLMHSTVKMAANDDTAESAVERQLSDMFGTMTKGVEQ